jgi:uncharacterized membrane protein
VNDNVWRGVFLTAAIFNWIVGASLLADNSAMMASLGMEALRFDPLYSPLVGLFIILFGAFSFAVFLDLDNRAIVFVNALGKLCAFAYFVYQWQIGNLPGGTVTLGSGDLIYALLFIAFLLTRRPASAGS